MAGFSTPAEPRVKSRVPTTDDTGGMSIAATSRDQVAAAATPTAAPPEFCACCDAVSTRPLLTVQGGRYVTCTSCGLVRTDQLPFEANLQARADYWSERHHLREEKLARQFDPVVQRMAYGKVLRKLSPYLETGRLLEIGCAAGGFLDAARRVGWEPSGVELAKSAAEYARSERQLDVRAGTIADVSFPDREFDAVVMLDVIEHVFHPAKVLEVVRPMLAPGGALLLMTPNVRGLGARWLKAEWEAYIPDDHLWLFDHGTLASLCAQNGFEVHTSWTMDCNPFELVRSLLPKRKPHDTPAMATSTAAGSAPSDTSARRHRLIRALSSSKLLRTIRDVANGLIGPTRLGDKLYMLAERAPSRHSE